MRYEYKEVVVPEGDVFAALVDAGYEDWDFVLSRDTGGMGSPVSVHLFFKREMGALSQDIAKVMLLSVLLEMCEAQISVADFMAKGEAMFRRFGEISDKYLDLFVTFKREGIWDIAYPESVPSLSPDVSEAGKLTYIFPNIVKIRSVYDGLLAQHSEELSRLLR